MAIEHRVQSPSEEFIDDPSIIFYDPDEKADFVYKAVPFVTQDLDFSYVQPRVDELLPHYSYSTEGSVSSTMLEDVSLRRKGAGRSEDSIPSPEYDDSLDGGQSQSGVTSNNSSAKSAHFYGNDNKNNDIIENSEFATSLPNDDMLDFDDRLSYPMMLPPRLESTRNDYNNSHQQENYQTLGDNNTNTQGNLIDQYKNVNLYEEDNLFSEVRNMNLANRNKGYASDAESIKTYQDSGVYDGDLADSPKSIGSVARQLVFDDYDESKFAAFKTPMSSRQSSVESLLMQEYTTLRDHPSSSFSNSSSSNNNKENQRNDINVLGENNFYNISGWWLYTISLNSKLFKDQKKFWSQFKFKLDATPVSVYCIKHYQLIWNNVNYMWIF